ncbi:MAG: MBOAT family protein, partial [Candidatus Aminicenantes bacterium]|nr:MBOAT family protein [Candidatus Aminicenantes bacterium]
FNSIDFWGFFAVIFALYFFVPQKFKWLFLLLASYFFYGSWKKEYLLLLAFPTLVTYIAARGMDAARSPGKRKLFFWSGLTVTLGLLIVFKYLGLFWQTFLDLLGYLRHQRLTSALHILLPLGISFFTFRMISYLIDVYLRRIPAEKHLGIYALYVSFFPQLLAGPIDRAAHLIPQLKSPVRFDWDRITSGFRLIVWGLFKKLVIADRLLFFVTQVFRHPHDQRVYLLFAAYFYAFQIYCDFSGYSDMAIGVSRILGFESQKNFDFPYFSKSISEFWNRWHISLSSWLRDYLFLPLAYATMRRIEGARLLGVKAETWGYFVGTILTMLLGGLWHGAGWTFVIWGGLYGVYMTFAYASKRLRKRLVRKTGLRRLPRLHAILSIFITFNLVSFAWIFFRSPTFPAALTFISRMQLRFPDDGSVHFIFDLLLLLPFLLIEFFYKNSEHGGRIAFWRRFPKPVKMAFFALFCCLLIVFAMDTANEFIYMQF